MPKKVVCNGTEYSSVSEFARDFGLVESTAARYLREGKTPEEIVEQLGIKPCEKKKGDEIKIEGRKFNSISQACRELKLQSPAYIYDLKKRKNITAEKAIEQAYKAKKLLEEQIELYDDKCSQRKKRVIIEGKTFSSIQDAFNAYNVAPITVYSRMKREGISLEEAILRQPGRQRTLSALISSFYPAEALPIVFDEHSSLMDKLEMTVFIEFREKGLKPNLYKIDGNYAIVVQSNKDAKTWVVFGRSCEIVLQDFFTATEVSKEDLLEYLNDVNRSYLGISIFCENVNADKPQIVLRMALLTAPGQRPTPKAVIGAVFDLMSVGEKIDELWKTK